MKIFKTALICLSMVALISTGAYAAASSQTAAGGAVTFTTDTDFSFTPSPGTLMHIITTATAYALTATSSKTNTSQGIVYGAVSTQSPIFQTPQTSDGALINPTDASTLSGDFKDKAGNAFSADGGDTGGGDTGGGDTGS